VLRYSPKRHTRVYFLLSFSAASHSGRFMTRISRGQCGEISVALKVLCMDLNGVANIGLCSEY